MPAVPLFFIPTIAAYIAKNATVINALAAAELYGYHRCYRRLLEGTKVLKLSKAQESMLKDNIKMSMRFPSTAYNRLINTETYNIAERYAEYIVKSADGKVPPFFVSIAKYMLKKSSFGKWADVIQRAVKK